MTAALIAVGVGTSGALFSVVDGLLLRPLPLPDAGRVVVGLSTRDGEPFNAAGRDVHAWAAAGTLARTGAASTRSHTHSDGGESFRFTAAHVTPGYLEVLGVEPVLGRRLHPGDTGEALIGHHLWQERFDGSEAVLGSSLDIDGVSHVIVGVAPPRFDLPMRTEAWVPMDAGELQAHDDSRRFFFVGRLREGIRLEDARAEIVAVTRRLSTRAPGSHAGWGAKLVPLREQLLYDIDRHVSLGLRGLLGAVAFLFLVTCANATSLTLIRLLQRRPEMRLRTILGARDGRLRHQVIVECLVVALLGGAGGTLLAAWALPLLAEISPIRADAFGSALLNLRLGLRGVVFCLSLTVLAGLLTGLMAASHGPRDDPSISSRRNRDDELTRGDQRSLHGLALSEIAIGVVLLVTPGWRFAGSPTCAPWSSASSPRRC